MRFTELLSIKNPMCLKVINARKRIDDPDAWAFVEQVLDCIFHLETDRLLSRKREVIGFLRIAHRSTGFVLTKEQVTFLHDHLRLTSGEVLLLLYEQCVEQTHP